MLLPLSSCFQPTIPEPTPSPTFTPARSLPTAVLLRELRQVFPQLRNRALRPDLQEVALLPLPWGLLPPPLSLLFEQNLFLRHLASKNNCSLCLDILLSRILIVFFPICIAESDCVGIVDRETIIAVVFWRYQACATSYLYYDRVDHSG